jgi:hypothetical protein
MLEDRKRLRTSGYWLPVARVGPEPFWKINGCVLLEAAQV